MSCQKCEDTPLRGCYVRVGNGNVEIIACEDHARELIFNLRQYNKIKDSGDDLIYQYKGGEDDGEGGLTEPRTWKEAYEEEERYEDWAKKEMQAACERIKAHPEWNYGPNAYPSPHERAIVAGCGMAVKELQEENKKLKDALQEIGNLCGKPTMAYSELIENTERGEVLKKIYEKVANVLL